MRQFLAGPAAAIIWLALCGGTVPAVERPTKTRLLALRDGSRSGGHREQHDRGIVAGTGCAPGFLHRAWQRGIGPTIRYR